MSILEELVPRRPEHRFMREGKNPMIMFPWRPSYETRNHFFHKAYTVEKIAAKDSATSKNSAT